MGDVFVCHSRHDHELVIFINEVCVSVGIRAREFEFDFATLDRTANEEIATIMEDCSVLFLLLGKNVAHSFHTSNWISSEVGLAKGMNIPIWVIEDWLTPISFPVPFVDHYARLDIGDPAHRHPEHHSYMQEVAKAYGSHPARKGDIVVSGTALICREGGCQAVFAVHQPPEHIEKCPVCTVPQRWTGPPEPPISE